MKRKNISIRKKLKRTVLILAGAFLLAAGMPYQRTDASLTSEDMSGYTKITTVEEMNAFIKDVNKDKNAYSGRHVCLMNDIKYDKTVNNFQKINKFAGTFDGMGHSISGINMTSLNVQGKRFDVAMFGEVTRLIRNLEIKDSVFHQEGSYADANGVASIAITNSGTISQCVIAADTLVYNDFYYDRYCNIDEMGGIVVYNPGTIVNTGMEGCVQWDPGDNLDFTLCTSKMGGIAYGNSGTINNSYFSGHVKAPSYDFKAFAYENGGVIENVYQAKLADGGMYWSVGAGSGTGNNYYYPSNYSDSMKYDKLYKVSVPVDNMKSSDFVKQLNATKGDDRGNHEWIIDSKRNNGYPVLKPIYSVLLNGGTEKGKLTVENYWYYAGETVTVSAEANAGYQYNGIKVTDSKGNVVNTYQSGKDYSFVMPSDYVNVDGDFTEIKVSQITFPKDTYSVNKGYDIKLKATVVPEDAVEKKLTYVSSDPSIAEVQEDGTVLGKKEGTVQITVSATDGSNVQKMVNVTVTKVMARNISLNDSRWRIVQGGSFTIKTSFKPSDVENKSLSYASTNTKVATVNASGFVKGKYPGLAYIKVSTLDGSNITKSVKVIVLPKKVSDVRAKRSGSRNRISWSKVSGASGYSIYRSTSRNGYYRKMDMTGSGKRWIRDSSVTSGVTYYYSVRAYKMINGKPRYGKYSRVSVVYR